MKNGVWQSVFVDVKNKVCDFKVKMSITGSWFIELSFFSSITIFALIYAYFQRQYKFWSDLNVKHATPTFPVGNVKGAFRTPLATVLRDYYDEFKGDRYVGVWMFCRPVLIIRELELIKSMFVRDFGSFQDRGCHVDEKTNPFSGRIN